MENEVTGKISQLLELLEDLEKVDSSSFSRNSSLVVGYLHLAAISGTSFRTTLEKQKT